MSQRYTREFKEQALAQVDKSSINEVGERLGEIVIK